MLKRVCDRCRLQRVRAETGDVDANLACVSAQDLVDAIGRDQGVGALGVVADGLEYRARLVAALPLFMVVAWRIARLMRLGRTCPNLDAELFFDPDEIQAAYLLRKKTPPGKSHLNDVLSPDRPYQRLPRPVLAIESPASRRSGAG